MFEKSPWQPFWCVWIARASPIFFLTLSIMETERPQPVFGYPWEMKQQISWDNIQFSFDAAVEASTVKTFTVGSFNLFRCLTFLFLFLLFSCSGCRASSGDRNSQMLLIIQFLGFDYFFHPHRVQPPAQSPWSLTIQPQTFTLQH